MGYLNSDGLETQIQYIKGYVQDEMKKHASLPVGFEYFSPNPNIPQGSLPLFGGEYSRDTYSALWDWVQTQTGYLITDSAWVTLSNTQNGNVPFYSSGDGSTTFRVPSLKCWVKGANGTVSEVGSYLQAGLPNITGTMASHLSGDTWLGWDNGYGAMYSDGTTSSAFYETGHSKASGKYQLLFDASRSNSIYGNSTTVQPHSIVGMWLVKAYGVVEDTGRINEQQYIDDRMADLKNVYLPANYQPMSYGTGTFVSNSASDNVRVPASNTNVVLLQITLSAGVWVVQGQVRFASFTVGRLQSAIVKDGESLSTMLDGVQTVLTTTASSYLAAVNVTRIIKLNETTIVKLQGYSDSANTASVRYINAVKIA